MSERDKRAAMLGYKAAHGAAMVLSRAALLAAAVAMLWPGLETALAIALAAWVFHMAKP